MSFIAKQPNRLYCRFSSVVDCPTHWNMTREDYINYKMEQAREEAEYILDNQLRHFELVKNNFIPNNTSREELENILREMGE